MMKRNNEIEAALAAYLAEGGEMLTLRDGTKQEQRSAERYHYHLSRSIEGDERSAKMVQRADRERAKVKIFF